MFRLGLKTTHENKLAAEMEARREKYLKESAERMREFEKQHQLELQEKMRKIEAEHKLQMREARDLTNRKIEAIEKEKIAGNGYLIEKLEKMEKVNREEITKQINQITESTEPRLEEYRRMEDETYTQIRSGQSDLENVHEEKMRAQREQWKELSNLRIELDRERRKTDENNLIEIRDYTKQIQIAEQETSQAASRMQLENIEKKNQNDQELQNTLASTQQSLLNAQNTCLKNEKLIKLNREIVEMGNKHLSMKQSFDNCIKYLGEDFVWNPFFFKRAEMKFNELDKKIQDFALHVNRMKPKLRNIPEQNERSVMTWKVQGIMNTQGKLKTSAAKFSGCMMNQSRGWEKLDVMMFERLYTELEQGVNSIATLDTLNTEIRAHLQGISSFQLATIQ
ncbi:unnamed protein product [Caenorhabditis brenneri]